MMIGARTAAWAKAGGWVNPYVTDGLIAMWDGEWNAGQGVHDDNGRYVDLIGNCGDMVLNSGTVDTAQKKFFVATSNCSLSVEDMSYVNSVTAEELRQDGGDGITVVNMFNVKNAVDRTRGVISFSFSNAGNETNRPSIVNNYYLFTNPNLHRTAGNYAGDSGVGTYKDDMTMSDLSVIGLQMRFRTRHCFFFDASGRLITGEFENCELYSQWSSNYSSYVSRWITPAKLSCSIKNGVEWYGSLIYDRVISNDELQSIYNALKARFGLT